MQHQSLEQQALIRVELERVAGVAQRVERAHRRARLVAAGRPVEVAARCVTPGEAVSVQALERRDALPERLAASESLACGLSLLDSPAEPSYTSTPVLPA